jgi:hypothetical protein
MSTSSADAHIVKIDGLDTGLQFSLGITSEGILCAGYSKHHKLHLARFINGKWQTMIVPNAGISGQSIAMAIGPDDSVHLFSFMEVSGLLRHDSFVDGEWTSEEVEAAARVAQREASIDAQIAPDGKIVVCYFDFDPNAIRLVIKPNGGEWEAKELYCGRKELYNFVDMELDKDGNPLIAFMIGSAPYISSTPCLGIYSDQWDYHRVVKQNSSYHPSLMVDSNGNPILAYGTFGKTDFYLNFAKREGGEWSRNRVIIEKEPVNVFNIAKGNTDNMLVGYVARTRKTDACRLVLVDIGKSLQRYDILFEKPRDPSSLVFRKSCIIQEKDGSIHVLFSNYSGPESEPMELCEAVFQSGFEPVR